MERNCHRYRLFFKVFLHDTMAALLTHQLESMVFDKGTAPSVGTRVDVGLKPTIPQKAAGMRHDPPVSVPMAAIAMPSATETAPPDDDPPGIRPVALS